MATRPRDSEATESPEPNGPHEARGRAARTGGRGKPQQYGRERPRRTGKQSATHRGRHAPQRSDRRRRGGAGHTEGEAQAKNGQVDATRRARAGGARRDLIHKGKYSNQRLRVRRLRGSSLEIYSGVTATAKGFHKGKFTFVNSCLRISLYKLIFSYVNRRLHL